MSYHTTAFHRHRVPSFMRHVPKDEEQRGCTCHWEKVEQRKEIIMDKYFNKNIEPDQMCELFCIENVPAVAMVYRETNKFNNPKVEAFYLNQGLLMLFDAGPHMRKKLHTRYKHICIKDAKNRNDFLFF